jgi:hypothetical protein
MSAFSMAIPYRMNGLFAGSVNRTHPCSVVPHKQDPTVVGPIAPGTAVKVNATGDGVIPIGAGDAALTNIFGIVVRAYPVQPGVWNTDGTISQPMRPVDVLRYGYIGVRTTGTPVIGGPAFVVLADGSFASATSGATTTGAAVNAHFNGPPDANGNAELVVTEFQG